MQAGIYFDKLARTVTCDRIQFGNGRTIISILLKGIVIYTIPVEDLFWIVE
jgi:hypothetical protein